LTDLGISLEVSKVAFASMWVRTANR
jgi:hypothetical protein